MVLRPTGVWWPPWKFWFNITYPQQKCGRGRGTGGGFVSPSSQNVMDFIDIATLGDAKDFGDLTVF